METKKQKVRHEDKMAGRRLVPEQPKRDTMRYYEFGVSAKQASTLRRIVKHGLEDCERRLEVMAQAKLDATQAGEEWPKHPESINNEMYREAKGIVRQEMSMLDMMRLQMEPKVRS